jgi:hypothetical protein
MPPLTIRIRFLRTCVDSWFPWRRHSATSQAGLPAVRGQLARKPEVPLDAFKNAIQKHPRELFQMRPADKPESAVVQ